MPVEETQSKQTRIALVNQDKCKPKKCRLECKRSCPIVRAGTLCIEVESSSKIAFIAEELCVGCGICVKKCPFEAINIINLPTNLESQVTHRYGPNSFKLHRLPMPRPGQVLGLVGTNGIGKSTAVKILSGKLKPNFGLFRNPPDWEKILENFRGSELQNYFSKILQNHLKAVVKPQYVDNIPKVAKGFVGEMINKKDDKLNQEHVLDIFDLTHLTDRNIADLSGGELQRFACAVVCVQKADVYIFDEPSSYLDVKQRLNAALAVREQTDNGCYVIVVEHDLAVLDYLSDFVSVLYGSPGAYGVVTMPFSVREGINIFLDGMIPTENMRFREFPMNFKVVENALDEEISRYRTFEYPNMVKTLGDFKLTIERGSFTNSEIIVMLGENGTGKTTFIRILAGNLQPDDGAKCPSLNVSYKPQKISPKSESRVDHLLANKIQSMFCHPQFGTDVLRPLEMERLYDQQVQNLSGGELQRLAITLCLGKPADVYLIDEPSAYLDSEQRLHAAKVIKRFVLHAKKTAFIVEHDFIMATYLADRVVVFDGEPGVNALASSPVNMVSGMNRFLKSLNITFRRDPNNARPRINKLNSLKDSEQKQTGNFFFVDD